MGPKMYIAANELLGLWKVGPPSICNYDSTVFLPNTTCGQTVPDNALYCPSDACMILDIQLLNRLDAQFGSFASVAIIAHEWGHYNQHYLGMLEYGPSKMIELHADCQAGIFAATQAYKGQLTVGEAYGSYMAFCNFGDPYVSPWFAPTHGTCEERATAFQHGFNYGSQYLEGLCDNNPLETMQMICAF
jgi:predicted metalloprotease